MAKERYQFNPELLRFVPVKKTVKQRVLTFFAYSLWFIGASVAFNVVFTHFLETPKEQSLKRERRELVLKYDMLNEQVAGLEQDLYEIQQRDDQIYRPVFNEKPIPASVRQAGFGGVNRYADLESLSESRRVISTAKRIDKLSKQLYIQSKSYDKIMGLARNKDKMIASIPAIQPIAIDDLNRISSYYGTRRDPYTGRLKWHKGMDFTGEIGTNIRATGDAVVKRAEYSRYGYGYLIVLDHGYGYETRYAHLDKMLVEKGMEVKRGTVIGHLGNSGRSTGPHLHYEVRKNNDPMNPINFYFNDISAEQYDLMVQQSAREGGQTMD